MENPKEILDRAKSLKSKDANEFLLDKTRGTLTSAVIGGGLGLIIGYTRKYNLILSVAVGASICGLISRIIVYKK
jgi:hypothetical protein